MKKLNEVFSVGQQVKLKKFNDKIGEVIKVTSGTLKVSLPDCKVAYTKITDMDAFLKSVEII